MVILINGKKNAKENICFFKKCQNIRPRGPHTSKRKQTKNGILENSSIRPPYSYCLFVNSYIHLIIHLGIWVGHIYCYLNNHRLGKYDYAFSPKLVVGPLLINNEFKPCHVDHYENALLLTTMDQKISNVFVFINSNKI